jgi:Fe-S oxidoreductase
MALLKAELLHARIIHRGLTWTERLLSSVDALGRAGCAFPALTNAALHSWPVRILLEKILDLDARRGLPFFTRQRFDRWFRNHHSENVASRGRVLLWDDTFTRYYEPHIGMAAVKVLEAAGFEVTIARERKCCGRPAFSQGNLEAAASFGRHNVEVLNADVEGLPIIFLEPSCYTMFTEDYFELKLPGARRVANRCFLFEQFMDSLLTHEPDSLKFKNKPGKVVIHAHCHVRSHMNPAFLGELAQRLPNKEVNLLDSGCCGMAGGFGMLKSKYELSVKVAEPLAQMVRSQPYGTAVVASGTSCRHQLLHTAGIRPRHMAELMADSLA